MGTLLVYNMQDQVPVISAKSQAEGQEAMLCTATVMPSCFWIIMFPLSDSRHTTGMSVGSEVSLAACWASTDITPACSSDSVPRPGKDDTRAPDYPQVNTGTVSH